MLSVEIVIVEWNVSFSSIGNNRCVCIEDAHAMLLLSMLYFIFLLFWFPTKICTHLSLETSMIELEL